MKRNKLKFLLLYNLLICLALTLLGALAAKSGGELTASLIYLPLVLFFSGKLIGLRRSRAKAIQPAKSPAIGLAPIPSAPIDLVKPEEAVAGEEVRGIPDLDRRVFLKLIGSAGLSLFLLALFTKKAQAAFFGSVPGPGVIALKDTAGNKIDPAQHHPTAGFKIARLDDTSSTTYAYFGFVNKTGAWYLQREQLTGADTGQYLYSTGPSDFSTAWTNRASPTPAYNTFNETF